MPSRRDQLVRFVPLVGSPGWMPGSEAKRLLQKDDALYLEMLAADMKPSHAPRIEYPTERTRRRSR